MSLASSYKTKSEYIYEELRREIINRKLKPGEKIVMSALAEKIGCSVIPIREAVRKLESDGLVQMKPHVGAIVTQHNFAAILEIFKVRTELECIAMRWAAPFLKEGEIEALEKINARMQAALENQQYGKLSTLNKDFHFKIYKACNSPALINLIEEWWNKAHVTSYYSLAPERAIESIKEHESIIEAIKKKDSGSMGAMLRKHKNAAIIARAKSEGGLSGKEIQTLLEENKEEDQCV